MKSNSKRKFFGYINQGELLGNDIDEIDFLLQYRNNAFRILF